MPDVHEESLWLESLLRGSAVDQCWFGPATWLILFTSERSFMLSLSTPCEFSNADGTSEMDPQVDPDNPAPAARLLALYTRRVESLRVFRDGMLDIKFSAGLSVTVPPSEHYEAWQFVEHTRSVAEGGLMVVCMPGGELAIWRDR